MTLVVLAEAADGYKVAYSLAELDEQFGGRRVIVALSQNDAPLPDAEGPLRVVVPGETHHARWIRQLTVLRLVRAEKQREEN
jgi:DMSO/TMAO reductase YedYZ molybdopterin-dependent catalytic subunit